MSTIIATASASLIAIYYALQSIANRSELNEPPIVSASIPFLGHIIGVARKKSNYYVELYQKTGYPISSILLGLTRVYIVNSPDLIKLIQKQPKVFAFPPIAVHFTKNITGSSEHANSMLEKNCNGDEGDWSYMQSFYKMLGPTLAPGPKLDNMNRAMIENLATSFQNIQAIAIRSGKLELYEWVRHEITIATTNSVYGPLNPFKDPKVEQAFWDFNDDLGPLMLNVVPSITASKGHSARKLVCDAFYHYFTNKGHEKGSTLVQARYQNSIDHRISVDDIARFEVGGAIALLLNTAPSAFWMLVKVFSESGLLQRCRQELEAIVKTTTSANGESHRVVDITEFKQHCPLVVAAFSEILRQTGTSLGVRKVMEDTILDGKYLLKRDATIMMPSRVLHSDPTLWGDDVTEFKPERFIRGQTLKRHDPAAFRGFGGGTTLCPGRHFATTEILAMVTMFILRYELEPYNGWITPTTHRTALASSIFEPDTDITVKVSQRTGFTTGHWSYGLKESEMLFAVAAEDQSLQS